MSRKDTDALATRLARALPGQPRVEITGVASLGAQRQTFFLEIGDGEETHPAVAQIASPIIAPTNVENEAKLLREAIEAGVPVPEVLAVDADLRAIISARVEGETIPRKILRLVEADPRLGSQLTMDCGHALAAIHQIPVASLPGLDDYSDPLRYADEMEALLETLSAPHPTFRLGIRWLRRHAPAPTPRLGPRRSPRLGTRPSRRPHGRPRLALFANLALRPGPQRGRRFRAPGRPSPILRSQRRRLARRSLRLVDGCADALVGARTRSTSPGLSRRSVGFDRSRGERAASRRTRIRSTSLDRSLIGTLRIGGTLCVGFGRPEGSAPIRARASPRPQSAWRPRPGQWRRSHRSHAPSRHALEALPIATYRALPLR